MPFQVGLATAALTVYVAERNMEALMSTSFENSGGITREILTPRDCAKLHPGLAESIWVYNYHHKKNRWDFSVGTHIAEGKMPGRQASLSLGGFRIVPEARASIPGFSTAKEAVELSLGMEEKVFWSRVVGVGGPIGIKNLNRIVGGKCVLLCGADARVGQKRDQEALDFAIECLRDFEAHSGVFVVTGQDLGHAQMFSGKESSLQYLNRNFRGAVLADTSKPTAEGNFYMLKGMLASFDIKLPKARVGLVGVGNVGEHVLRRLLESNAEVVCLESVPAKCEAIRALGQKVYGPKERADFYAERIDALVVNANGGSLDDEAIELISKNSHIKIVNGCENLVMPNPSGEKNLLLAGKVYCHTELCGMMGYLTAVEEYLSKLEKSKYRVEDMFEASRKLEEVGLKGTQAVVESDFQKSFTECVRELYAR